MHHELILSAGDVVQIGERRMRVLRIEADRVIVEVVDGGDAMPGEDGSGGRYALVLRNDSLGGSSPCPRVELQAI
jgi:hypothetical protein